MKETSAKTTKLTTINFLDRDTWDARLAECVKALDDCRVGTDEERRIGLETVIEEMYPMYGLGVIKNLAGRAMEKFIKNRRVAEITQGIKVHFLSVWLDHDDWRDRRIALIGILGLIKEDIDIFNDVFYSGKSVLEDEAKKEVVATALSVIGNNLGYWEHFSPSRQKSELRDIVRKVLEDFGKGRIAKRQYLIVLGIVSATLNKKLVEYAEAEKVRKAREEKIRQEQEAAFKAEQLIRAAEREEARKREEAENLRRLAEKKARKAQREKEVNFAPMVTLSNGKKAKVLPTTDHVMHLSASQYAVVDEQIYLRTGNGVKKDEFLSIQKETKSSSLTVVASATVPSQKLPENLDELWVNKGQKTLKAHVVPAWVRDDQKAKAAIKIRGYKYVAILEGGTYTVYIGEGMWLVDEGFKKATDEQRRTAKEKLYAVKNSGNEAASCECIGNFGEALRAAMA